MMIPMTVRMMMMMIIIIRLVWFAHIFGSPRTHNFAAQFLLAIPKRKRERARELFGPDFNGAIVLVVHILVYVCEYARIIITSIDSYKLSRWTATLDWSPVQSARSMPTPGHVTTGHRRMWRRRQKIHIYRSVSTVMMHRGQDGVLRGMEDGFT